MLDKTACMCSTTIRVDNTKSVHNRPKPAVFVCTAQGLSSNQNEVSINSKSDLWRTALLLLILITCSVSLPYRVSQTLYYGSCTKTMNSTSMTANHVTYCDCTQENMTCSPGRDIVSCVKSTSTGKGRHYFIVIKSDCPKNYCLQNYDSWSLFVHIHPSLGTQLVSASYVYIR